MNAKRVLCILALAVMGLGMWGAGGAEAATSDALTISITPTANVQVDLDTTTVAWNTVGTGLDLSALSMGATDFMIRPATITATGTFNPHEVGVQGTDLAGNTWILDPDEVAAENQLQLYALFTPTSRSTAPTEANYTGDFSNGTELVLTASEKRYGLSGSQCAGDDCNFQNNDETNLTGDENLDPAADNKRHVWLRADMPPTTSVSGVEQRFTVTFTARSTE